MPGDLTAGSAPRSSVHFGLPSARPTAWTTPLRAPAYTTPLTTAGAGKNGDFASYTSAHLRSPVARSNARSLPSVAVATTVPSATATHDSTPPGTSLRHFSLPSSREYAATSPLAPLSALGS